jgi:hypothetical protein
MDGAGRFLPAHRGPGRLGLGHGRHDAPFRDRGRHRRELRRVVSARRARPRVVFRLGAGLRHILVVPGSAHAPAACPTGLTNRAVPYSVRWWGT